MLKGINKRMVVIRLDGNRFYESACFTVRRDTDRRREEERDMLREAGRILEEMDVAPVRRRGRLLLRLCLWALTLVIGAVIGFGLSFFLG